MRDGLAIQAFLQAMEKRVKISGLNDWPWNNKILTIVKHRYEVSFLFFGHNLCEFRSESNTKLV